MWLYQQCGHLRINIHRDNTVMQNLIKKLGFVCCGTIYVEEDDYKPRFCIFGFQYVQADGDIKVNPEDFEGIAIYSDMEDTLT